MAYKINLLKKHTENATANSAKTRREGRRKHEGMDWMTKLTPTVKGARVIQGWRSKDPEHDD